MLLCTFTHLVRRSISLLSLLSVLLAWSYMSQAQAAATPTLTFGVVPQQSAARLARTWGPLLMELEHRAGVRLVFATAADIPTFEQRVRAGDYDLAYMNPYHFTVFHASTGYQALARARDRQIAGILVVRRDAAFNGLEDLATQPLAFPAPAAFAASLITRSALTAQGVPFTPHYVGSHDSVYKGVISGRFAVGGGIMRTFNALPQQEREQLRVLWTSPGYTPHAIAVHPRIEASVRTRVLEALLSLAEDETGRGLLAPLAITGFQSAHNQDWDDVRALGIDLLE